MLQKIRPNRKKSRGGSLTKDEKGLVQGLLSRGYIAQDITYIVNLGRSTTVNQARIAKNSKIPQASDKEIEHYLKVQASYDPKTLLNPFRDERLIRAREAMLSAVTTFNNPSIIFKTEVFSVLANIAWTYLLHEQMESTTTGSSILDNGNSITLSGTLDKSVSPITDNAVIDNLRKIIEIRDAVEHTFFVNSDGCFNALFQSCCVNFEKYMTDWFGGHLSLSKDLSLALQFVKMGKPQLIDLEPSNVPEKIRAIYTAIQNSEHADNNAFQATVYYGLETSPKTSAEIHRLVKYDDIDPQDQQTVIKRYNPTKWSETQVVSYINSKGFKKFKRFDHQQFWKTKWDSAAIRNKEAIEYGELILKSQWVWHQDKWALVVLKYCQDSGDKFT